MLNPKKKSILIVFQLSWRLYEYIAAHIRFQPLFGLALRHMSVVARLACPSGSWRPPAGKPLFEAPDDEQKPAPRCCG